MGIRTEGTVDYTRDMPARTRREQAAAPGRSGIAAVAGRMLLGAVLVAGSLLTAFAVGFVWFAVSVSWSTPPSDPRADGIVVLTGGRDRVQGAVELLEEGRGRRLLISGVHPATRAEDILKVTAAQPELFACCVDLGHRAETTVGNAFEAADWARANGFKSLIVVTSAYHMPRSMVELDRVLPGVTKVAWPVRRTDLNIDRWFSHPGTVKLLMQEYVKYIITRFGGRTASLTRPADPATTASIRRSPGPHLP